MFSKFKIKEMYIARKLAMYGAGFARRRHRFFGENKTLNETHRVNWEGDEEQRDEEQAQNLCGLNSYFLVQTKKGAVITAPFRDFCFQRPSYFLPKFYALGQLAQMCTIFVDFRIS